MFSSTGHTSEAELVAPPVPVEVDGAVLTPLDQRPAAVPHVTPHVHVVRASEWTHGHRRVALSPGQVVVVTV